jgi:hypothetical protein
MGMVGADQEPHPGGGWWDKALRLTPENIHELARLCLRYGIDLTE